MENNIRLLKAVLEETKKVPENFVWDGVTVDEEYGIVYPTMGDFLKSEVRAVLNEVFPNLQEFGNTFHKSWKAIADTDQKELWTQAVIHYFTTYGLESLGLDNEGFIYIPDEVCNTPELQKFRVITFITVEDLEKIIRDNLESGVALKQETIENYLTIAKFFDFDLFSYDIKNKEMRTILFVKGDIVPDNGEDIVRVLNYVITGNSMIIKNRTTFNDIKTRLSYKKAEDLDYIERLLIIGNKQCASVFYRYKMFFLAMRKCNDAIKTAVNQIRRVAKREWRPKPNKPFLSTKILQDGRVAASELEELTNYELAKIYNKLNYVIKTYPDGYYDAMVVRNGSLFIEKEKKTISPTQFANIVRIKDYILEILQYRLNPHNDKCLVVQDTNLEIAFPTSEKSFIGDIPLYSRVACEDSSVIGVAWENWDIDLSALIETGEKIGWNGWYKSRKQDIMYSGDCTRGGAEALYFNSEHQALVMANIFYGKIPSLDLFISNEKEFNLRDSNSGDWDKPQYIYDPNNIIYSTKIRLDQDQPSKVLGLYEKTDGKTLFTFANLALDSGNVSKYKEELTPIAMEVLHWRGVSSLKLSDIYAVTDVEGQEAQQQNDEEAEDWEDKYGYEYIELTNLDKSTILGLALENKD